MVFSSISFLLIFLPIVLIAYEISNLCFRKWKYVTAYKNAVLLIASLFFYAYGGLNYFWILLCSIAINYIGAILIGGRQEPRVKKIILIIVITINVLMLGYFKYFNWIISMIEALGKFGFNLEKVILPIGISFFTFQALSYTIDVYLNKVDVQRSIFKLALYVSFFPQLVAGPIVKYSDVALQINERAESVEKFAQGIIRFCLGLGKKVIVANAMGEAVDLLFAKDLSTISCGAAWLCLIAYTIQIYYDFSGYSDMAIGLGKMFGFDFLENFNYPYTANSIQDFWRRWHISLSSWFKDYIYIPLGGNRKTKIRTYINLFIVFLVTGLWHGANYTFLLWGIIYGVFIVIEKMFLGKLLQKNPVKILNHIYVLAVVMLCWVFFRAPTVSSAFTFFGALFGNTKGELTIANFFDPYKLFIMAIGIILAGLPQRLLIKYAKTEGSLILVLKTAGAFFFLIISVFLLINTSYNPFIYFQF